MKTDCEKLWFCGNIKLECVSLVFPSNVVVKHREIAWKLDSSR